MIDDFFNTANVLIEKFDLNLEFILDGGTHLVIV
jgi:hypothetical protein